MRSFNALDIYNNKKNVMKTVKNARNIIFMHGSVWEIFFKLIFLISKQ
jgi:hypothetical protein